MPVCNMCESEFDVETAPGALMFGHPSTVREAVPVWKAHLCQICERRIILLMARPPIINTPTNPTVPKLLEALKKAKTCQASMNSDVVRVIDDALAAWKEAQK